MQANDMARYRGVEAAPTPHYKPKQHEYNAQIHVTYKKRLYQLRGDGVKAPHMNGHNIVKSNNKIKVPKIVINPGVPEI